MATKCCTKLEVAWKRCPIVFQGHPSNFKVTRDNISPILTRIERFWTVNPVWIHQWLRNAAQRLTYYRRSAFLFSKVIHQISRSHRRKNWFESNLRLLGLSQLSNPSDLPWLDYFCVFWILRSFPGLFSTCFEISIWNMVYTFSR